MFSLRHQLKSVPHHSPRHLQIYLIHQSLKAHRIGIEMPKFISKLCEFSKQAAPAGALAGAPPPLLIPNRITNRQSRVVGDYLLYPGSEGYEEKRSELGLLKGIETPTETSSSDDVGVARMPLDDRGIQNLYKELKNPKLDARLKTAIELRAQIGLAHKGKSFQSFQGSYCTILMLGQSYNQTNSLSSTNRSMRGWLLRWLPARILMKR